MLDLPNPPNFGSKGLLESRPSLRGESLIGGRESLDASLSLEGDRELLESRESLGSRSQSAPRCGSGMAAAMAERPRTVKMKKAVFRECILMVN